MMYNNAGMAYGGAGYNPGMQMNMGMNPAMMAGGMPMMMGNGGMFNNMFMYSGNPIGLQTRLESLGPNDMSTLREGTIICTGNQTTQMNICCLVCTIVWGSFLIFPLCFMCCDWWLKMTYPSFDVPEATYRAIQGLVLNSSIQVLTVSVVDNYLNGAKCQILYETLSRSRLKGFTFINNTGRYDMTNNNEYSNFIDNMRPIKKLPIATQIKWGTKIAV